MAEGGPLSANQQRPNASWPERMALAVYGFFMRLGAPLLRRKLLQRGAKEEGYLASMDERFGHYAAPAETRSELFWVHAVSLGETKVAAHLIATLRHECWTNGQSCRILLTHGTATGRQEGAKLLQAGDVQVWQPWDTPSATRAFLNRFNPRAGVLIETEVWPCLVAACAQQQVPLLLVNARLSVKSARMAQRLSWLSRPAFGGLTAVFAQTQNDAQRLRVVGGEVAGVFGNLKFDAVPNPLLLATGRRWAAQANRPVIALAISREGEELGFLQAWLASREVAGVDAGVDGSAAPAFQAMIVPRHPNRVDAVAALIAQAGFSVSRRSTWTNGPPTPDAQCVWLADTLGEMALYYGLSTVALLGGSFENLGGQNLIEAAACGCPVVCGPSTFNFEDAALQSIAAGSAFRAPDMQAALAQATVLASSAGALAHAQTQALAFSSAHRGATLKTAQALHRYLSV